MSTENSIIRIQAAHKYYNRGRSNELHVMNNINLELPASGMVAVFGRSGCGKTTLLNAIGGLDKIATGRVEVCGQDIREDTDTLRNRYIGYIFQNYNLNVAETVYENVAAALRLCGVEDESLIADRVTAALGNVGLEKYSARTPDTLSGGQQQRVAIARALVKNPAIILADEPTGNLDENNTVLVMDILKEISRTHLVLLVTHEAHLVDHYCDRVIEIVDGRIADDRTNSNAEGYVQRNKNDIYLGELSRTDAEIPGVKLEYYGEPTEEIKIRVIHKDGKIYLQTDDQTVKILDRASEIKVKEGVFEGTPGQTGAESTHGRPLDMSHLTPIEGKHFGRLYRFKRAFLESWRQNFSKKKKKGTRLLRIALIFQAILMVFMTATMGAGLKGYIDAKNEHNEALFYVPLSPDKDYTAISTGMGQYGMEYARVISGTIEYDTESLNIQPAAFMTADQTPLSATVRAQDIAHAKGLTVVAGTATPTGTNDILITTAVADDLIETSTVGYINEYRDLVGLVTANRHYEMGNVNLRIVGVVESDEHFYYVDGFLLAKYVFDYCYYSSLFTPASEAGDVAKGLEPGQIIYRDYLPKDAIPTFKEGDTVTVLGKTFTVVKTVIEKEEEIVDGEITYSKPGAKMEDVYYEEDVMIEEVYYMTDFVLTDADYVALSSSVGRTDPKVGFSPYYYETFDNGYTDYWCDQHLMIRSTDPSATATYLNAALGDDFVISPNEVLSMNVKDLRASTIVGIVSILILIAFMCLSVFFVMRSSFMSRVREVGILRAIGVSKRNLVFRFFVEAVLLVTLTLGIGYLCTSLLIASLADAVLFSSFFYFPIWLAVGLFVIVVAAALLFGVLPAILLLRKTPSEILSKYDI